jgi:hypothetical protein
MTGLSLALLLHSKESEITSVLLETSRHDCHPHPALQAHSILFHPHALTGSSVTPLQPCYCSAGRITKHILITRASLPVLSNPHVPCGLYLDPVKPEAYITRKSVHLSPSLLVVSENLALGSRAPQCRTGLPVLRLHGFPCDDRICELVTCLSCV